jgi:hypothetical protein
MGGFARAPEDRPTPPEVVSSYHLERSRSDKALIWLIVQLEGLHGRARDFNGCFGLWL